MGNLSDEPVFQRPRKPSAGDEGGVWGEPAQTDSPAAEEARREHAEWLARQWSSADSGRRLLIFALLCGLSGIVAVLCTLAKGTLGFAALAIAIGAPVIEEFAKVLGPLMVLEKKPWAFGSALAIVLVGLLSGLVFASVENLLYFNLYIPKESLTPELVRWRLFVCTALHMTGALISSIGLARAWNQAASTKGSFNATQTTPWLVAAIVLHGLYNTSVTLFSPN